MIVSGFTCGIWVRVTFSGTRATSSDTTNGSLFNLHPSYQRLAQALSWDIHIRRKLCVVSLFALIFSVRACLVFMYIASVILLYTCY